MQTISGRPGPPALSLTGTILAWQVQSVENIIEYKILYRFREDDAWRAEFLERAKAGAFCKFSRRSEMLMPLVCCASLLICEVAQ